MPCQVNCYADVLVTLTTSCSPWHDGLFILWIEACKFRAFSGTWMEFVNLLY